VSKTLTVLEKTSEYPYSAVARGLVKVSGTLNMEIADVKDTEKYGEMYYEMTYMDGQATVYTIFTTGIEKAKPGQTFYIEDDLTLTENLRIPAGVTVTLADGKYIIVDGVALEIGEPATSIGAGATVNGDIVVVGKGFVVKYPGSTAGKILCDTKDGADAKDSQFTLKGILYATVYGNGTADIENVKPIVKPAITGFRFGGWTAVDGQVDDVIGETDFIGTLVANQVEVTFKGVDGVTYFVDNKAQYQVDAPVMVAYGATITAVADYGYEGTPLVNGKAFVTIDDSIKTVTASGISPVEPEKQSGLGLTEILLIILVVLIVILAVVVILRLNRS